VERIGLFGGTFDPVHVGHLVAATWCRDALGLDRTLLVVANEPWQKVGTRRLSCAEDRYAVVQAAVEGVEGLEASRVEIDRGGPSYTADTVKQLRDEYPGATLFLVVGSDVATEMGTWQRVEEVVEAVELVVVDRGSSGAQAPSGAHAVDAAVKGLGWGGRVHKIRMPTIEISSSELRERLCSGRTVDFLIPAPAIRRILELGLYSGSG
jgi:nicotinate-nucleotide adenylyltransferase